MTEPSDIAKKNHSRYVRARDNGHAKYVERAAKLDGIYTGEGQWDDAIKARLEEQGRPALTFNMVLPIINTALGEHIKRDVMMNFKPRRNASREVANVLNKLAMQIMHANRFKFLEMGVAADGMIQERGYFDVRMDFSDHMQGDVKITSLDPITVVLDPDAKEYDPDTWNEVTVTRWMSLEEIGGKYGEEKATQLKSVAESGDNIRYDTIKFEEKTFSGDGAKSGTANTYVYSSADKKDDRDIRSVRVVERQYYKWTMEQMFVDPDTGDMAEVPSGWNKKKAAAFAAKAQLLLHKRPGRRVRWTASADSVLLFDDWSLYRTFTVVPYFPYFRRGKPFGMVTNLVGPQEYLNKTRSQELHIVNTTANSGWILEEGTLVNMTTDELETRGAETGLVLEHARGSNPPQKIQPNNVPSGLDRISEKAAYALREISGVNDGMLGMSAASVSGVALNHKSQQGSLQLEVPAANLEQTRNIVAKKILEMIQDFYTEERVITVTFDHNPKKDEEQIMINAQDAAGRIINNVTEGDYDIVISTSPSRSNFDESQFADLMDMRINGIAIPDTTIIRHSNLANRDDIADEVEKLLGQAEPSEQELEMMQQQQELAIETGKAELDKLMAQAENFKTASALNMAKASQFAGGENAPDAEFMRDELEAKIRMKREELQVRVQLAQLTQQAKGRAEQLRTATQLATTRFQGEVQLESARESAKAKSAAAAKKPPVKKK